MVVAVVVVVTGVRAGGFIATIFLASSSPAGHVFGDKSTLLGPALGVEKSPRVRYRRPRII